MQPLILVENERTEGGHYDHWQDATGERYQFPNGYRNKVIAGRRFIYYRGTRRAGGGRRIPEYFGHGVISEVFEDPNNDPNGKKQNRKWIAYVGDYTPFPRPVEFKKEGMPYEKIPKNLWGVAVREISEETYNSILSDSGIPPGDAEVSIRKSADSVLPRLAEYKLLVEKQVNSSANDGVALSSRSFRRSKFSVAIGSHGESLVFDYLQKSLVADEAKTLRWNAKEGDTPGWDIEYKSGNGDLVAIEVKSTTGARFPSIEITANEWSAAARLRHNYQLVLVANAMSDEPVLEFVEDPFGLYQNGVMTADPTVFRLQLSG